MSAFLYAHLSIGDAATVRAGVHLLCNERSHSGVANRGVVTGVLTDACAWPANA